jgi:hypothetical protein
MSDPPYVEGAIHRQVEARGIEFHVAEADALADGQGASGTSVKRPRRGYQLAEVD